MMRLKDNKRLVIFVCLGAIVLSILAMIAVYSINDQILPVSLRTADDTLKDLETPARKLLNGFLGVFFRFKHFGNINWLVVPLLIWFLVTAKKRERWQLALVFVWFVTFAFLCFKGYSNARYQLTLFPFTSAMFLFLLWTFLEGKTKAVKVLCISFVVLACVYNISNYFRWYNSYWKMRVSVETPHFPYRIINFLNHVPNPDKRPIVFTINQPIFYYHSNRAGFDSASDYAVDAWVEFKKKTGSLQPLIDFFKNFGPYILLSKSFKETNKENLIEEFLQTECELTMEDKDCLLYKVRRLPLDQEIESPGNRLIRIWDSTKTTPEKVSPLLSIIGQRGSFKMETLERQGKNIIVITPSGENGGLPKGEKPWIQFGYDLSRAGVDLRTLEGRHASFVVRLAFSPKLLSRDNCIAIMDYGKDGTVLPTRSLFSTSKWRTYILSTILRSNLQQVVTLFNFNFNSPDDRILLGDVKIVISDNKL